MNKSVILIFGAGVNQLELIREAKRIGVVTVAIDPQPDAPGKEEADFFYIISGSDYESTKDVALKHKVSGIVTGQMEKPLRMMSRLAGELGVIFYSPEVTERSLDKWLMKEAFIRENVPCARGILLKAGEETDQNKIESLTFPMILKPRDSFSSRGVLKLASFNELLTHLDESRFFASNGDVIIEEYMDGREFSVESITFKGETHVIQVTEKFITKYPYAVEMGHLQPAGISDGEMKAVTSLVKEAVKSLGIDNSASHAEVMLTGVGPKMVEIGARLGGDFISSYLTKASTGVSMDRAAVQVALGYAPDIERSCNRFSMIRYLELEPGRVVKELLPSERVLQLPGVIFAMVFLKPGDVTAKITHSALRPACVLVAAESRKECMRLTDNALLKLKESIVLT